MLTQTKHIAGALETQHGQRSLLWARCTLLLLTAAAAALVFAATRYGAPPSDFSYFASEGFQLVVLP